MGIQSRRALVYTYKRTNTTKWEVGDRPPKKKEEKKKRGKTATKNPTTQHSKSMLQSSQFVPVEEVQSGSIYI